MRFKITKKKNEKVHSSFTWKSHQEKSGQYDVKAENVLVDISVNMFSCCRVHACLCQLVEKDWTIF